MATTSATESLVKLNAATRALEYFEHGMLTMKTVAT